MLAWKVAAFFLAGALLAEDLRYSGSPLKIAFQCGEDEIQWAGMTCSEQDPCPVYVELSGIQALGQKIFLSGNIHSAETTLYSILLASADGGVTWKEPFARIHGAVLDRIQFFDFEAGWIAGQIVQPVVSDPFFLVTTDGGAFWRRRAVVDESGPGSILSFWFDSRQHGMLVADRPQSEGNRYEMYESMTGGESWMIRETSDKPMKIRSMPLQAAAEAWRIHADAATKSLHVQKKSGARWENIASFLVRMAECKPQPPAEAAPPVVTEQTEEDKPDIKEFRLGGPAGADAPGNKDAGRKKKK